MSFSALTIAVMLAYALGCLVYVYRWRGTTRYATLKQYLRKSWPIFARLQQRAQRLRARRRWLYNVCKFFLNFALLVALILILLAVLRVLEVAPLG